MHSTPGDGALHVGLCSFRNSSRKDVLKHDCEYVLVISQWTNNSLRLYKDKPAVEQINQGRIPMQLHGITLQKENKQINKRIWLLIYKWTQQKIQAPRQFGAYLFWHWMSGIFLIHSKHPTQCSDIIYTHLCTGRTWPCASVLCAPLNCIRFVLGFLMTYIRYGSCIWERDMLWMDCSKGS